MKIMAKLLWLVCLLCLVSCGGGGSSDDGPDNPIVNPPPDPDPDPDPGPDPDPDPDPDPGPSLGSRPSNSSCLAAPRPTIGSLTFDNAFPSLPIPGGRLTGLKQIPGNNDFWYIASRDGVIERFTANAGASTTTTVVDIRDRVALDVERGLLGFAFSPNFASDGAVYVSYTTDNRSRISRFISSDGGQSFASTAGSEQIVFEHVQNADIHNGGDLHFGPDGYLYLSLGDDGNSALAQDLSDVRGAILRIDPNNDDNLPTDAELTVREYAIPNDNPFVSNNSARPEIFAYGFRNPWRFTVDRQTGDVWVGDVGEADREEIDLVTPGGNFGWPHKEGSLCFQTNPCDNSDWIDPVVEYGHDEGLSVIGGHVYRGSAIPELSGKLIFSEWSSGTVWTINTDPQTGESSRLEIGSVASFQVVSWGQGNDGEIYAVSGGIPMLAAGTNSGQSFPQKLSDTGCVMASDVTQKTEGVIPYNVNMPLWSDNAAKKRYLAIPDGRFITINGDGHWELPIGSVLIKEFIVDGVLAETRLMMRHDDGDWAGYGYKWNSDGTDADLVLSGSTFFTGSRNWAIPSASQCLQCHTQVAGQTLGMETAQMNRVYAYEGAGEVNQLLAFHQLNLLTSDPGDPTNLPALSRLGDGASDEKHARDYLHVQCANCHQPGSVNDAIDLRWSTAFADMGLCNEPPRSGDLGVAGANLITPGSAAQSVLSLRMHVRGDNQMPRLGTELVDPDGTAAVDAWINSLQGCP